MSLKVLGLVMAVAVAGAFTLADSAWAGSINNPSHISNRGMHKVETTKAKRWLKQDGGSQSGYERLGNRSIVNVGSRRRGNCNLNVGATTGGRRAPKEVVVTAKEIINYCK